MIVLVAVALLAVTGVTVLAGSDIYLPIILKSAVTPTPGAPPASPTPSKTATPTPTPTETLTATHSPTPTATPTPSSTPTATATCTPTSTPSPTATPQPTDTPTNTATWTSSPTATASPTQTATATHTPTNTPTASPTPCNVLVQVVENPSFETGWSPWELTHGLVFRVATCGFDGTYGLGFGGSNDEVERVIQELAVPAWAETAAVYFSWKMVSEDSTIYVHDSFGLQVWDIYQGGYTIVVDSYVHNSAPRGVWCVTRLSHTNVEALQGHPLRVVLRAWTDGSYPTWWCIDDVQLVFACGSQVP